MEKTIATNATLGELINDMTAIVKDKAESTYACLDAMKDIQLLAEHDTTMPLRIYWGVRKNGTTIKYNLMRIAEWAAQQDIQNEATRCFCITCSEGKFNLTELN